MTVRRLKLSKDTFFSFVYVMMVFPTFWAGTSPDSTLATDTLRKTLAYISYSLFTIMVSFAWFYRIFIFDKNFFIGLFGVLVYWCFFYFSAINEVSPGLLNIGFLILFLAASHDIKNKIYSYIKILLLISSTLGILFYISTLMLVDIGQAVYPYYGSDPGTKFYVAWGFLNIFIEGEFARLCGPFNEPGYWGTVLALILTVEGYKINKANIVLFIAGVFSWSLAFFIIVSVNILYRYHNKIWKMLFVLIIMAGLMGTFLADNPNVEHMTTRMSFDSQGNWVGNNRSNEGIDKGLRDTVMSEYILFGHGTGYASTLTNQPFATYKTLIIEYGIMGTLLMYGAIFFLAIREAQDKFDAIWLILMFIFSLYQRPIIFLSIYFIILYGGIQHIIRKN